MHEYLESELNKLNENSKIKEEVKYLISLKPKFELAEIKENKVNSYSYIEVNSHFYSVPEYLVGKTVTTKIYLNDIYVYANNVYVCTHKRIDGFKEKPSIDIKHYLNTFLTKPGALKNSLALKSQPSLKFIYDEYYSSSYEETKNFIKIIMKNKDKNISEIIKIFGNEIKNYQRTLEDIESEKLLMANILAKITREQTSMYNKMVLGKD